MGSSKNRRWAGALLALAAAFFVWRGIGVLVPSLEPGPDRILDGKSLVPLLSGTASNWPERMIFSHWRGKVSVRTEQYRLDNTGRLYNLTDDPGQRRNIASDHQEVAARLSAAVVRWKKELLPAVGSAS